MLSYLKIFLLLQLKQVAILAIHTSSLCNIKMQVSLTAKIISNKAKCQTKLNSIYKTDSIAQLRRSKHKTYKYHSTIPQKNIEWRHHSLVSVKHYVRASHGLIRAATLPTI
jgi:predicted Holliday junction resolvase-like endonuclease